jgi:hypothetical protein
MSGEGGRNRRRKYTKTINEMRIEVMLSLFFADCCRTPWGQWTDTRPTAYQLETKD